MRVTLAELRVLIASEARRALAERADKKSKKASDDEDGPLNAILPDDMDVLLNDEMEEREAEKKGHIVPPSIRRQLRHHFAAYGIDGYHPPHARVK